MCVRVSRTTFTQDRHPWRMVPKLLMRPGRVVPQVHEFEELPLGVRRPKEPDASRSIAKIGEFVHVAFTAEGAWDPHRKASVQVRLGALALLVDERAGGEAVEPVGGRDGMHLVLGDADARSTSRRPAWP